MLFSKILVPTARENPRGISDQAVAKLARAGFVVPDQESKTVELLPMGFLLWEKVASAMADLARDGGFQVVSFEDIAEGADSISGRFVTSYRHLPLSFLGGDARRWDAVGFASDEGSSKEVRNIFMSIAAETARMAGLDVYFGESEGGEVTYASVLCGKGSWYGRNGFVCSSCSWCGDDSSPLSLPEAQGGDDAPLKEVETPGADTIAELCRQLGTEPRETLKTMFYAVESGDAKEIVAVLARGDHQINDRKLSHVLGGRAVRFADPLEIREAVGDLAGYLGPVGLPGGIRVIADRHVEGCRRLVAGANKPGFHIMNVCWGRDFEPRLVADIVSVDGTFPCPSCGASISPANIARVSSARIGNGTSQLSFQDDAGRPCLASRWEGSISLVPLVLSIAGGEKMPARFAPLDVNVVIASMRNDDAVGLGHSISEKLQERGLKVLVDDRDERAGVKFSDAELLGIPVTIVAGRESAESVVEAWQPDGTRGELPADAAIEQAVRWLR
jgi:prolyl-tRNA synthetase